MTNMIKRGAFIVFEGCDRSGKSTQSRLLVEHLQKTAVPVKHMVFPERSSNIGQLINGYLTNKQDLNDETIHLLFAANRWEHTNEILNLLKSGTTLVVDRYSYSGVVYSAAKGMSLKWCMSPENGLPRPDIVFYLKAEADALLDRGNYGEERYEKKEFQMKVAKIYEEIYEKEKDYWHQVDAKQNPSDIHEQIKEKFADILKNVETNEISQIKW
ncbi:thymidylate kinase [Calliphora vicina]|uniref:thymidylate kinase n=1 Tax=Calliphora vicina TaxID=7373 RepID=UPI00325BC3FF